MRMPQRSLRHCQKETQIEYFGATGPLMRAAGVETVVNSDELAIMGILEVARVFPKFVAAFRKLKAAAIERKPDAVILVDWPEFNLRLASSASPPRTQGDLLHQSAAMGVASASHQPNSSRRRSAAVDSSVRS